MLLRLALLTNLSAGYARMRHQTLQMAVSPPRTLLQFQPEHQTGQLGLAINTRGLITPLGLQIVAFWFAAVPLSALFSIHYGYGAPGLWYGILCGVTLSILFLGLRFRLVASRPIAAI